MSITVTGSSLAPFVEEQTRLLLEEAREAAKSPIPVPDIPVAGFSPLQLQAMQRGEQAVGGLDPYIQQAADFVPQQQAAIQKALTGLGSTQAGIQGLLAPEQYKFDPASAQDFFNPFEQQVVQQIQQDIGRQREEALGDVSSQLAGQAGAFGGSGADRARERVERRYDDLLNQQLSNLRYQGYQQAMGQAQQEFGQQFTRQQGLQSLLGDIAMRYPQLGSAIRDIGGDVLRLGGVQREADMTDIQLLSSLGGQQQSQLQAQQDAQRAQRVAQLQDPFSRIGFVRDVLTGVPQAGGTSVSRTTAPQAQPFGLAQLAGLGTLGLQIYNPFTGKAGALGNSLGFGTKAGS